MTGWRTVMAGWCLVLSLVLAGCDKAPVLAKGGVPPAFVLEDLRGVAHRFPEGFGQQPVLIRFWADWCPSCRAEMKILEQQHQQRKSRGLRVLAVNVGQDRETAQRFVDAYALTFDVLLDQESKVARQYGVTALPMSYLIDSQGRIYKKLIGETDAATLEAQLDLLMGGGA